LSIAKAGDFYFRNLREEMKGFGLKKYFMMKKHHRNWGCGKY
jgi:hypothetical protein